METFLNILFLFLLFDFGRIFHYCLPWKFSILSSGLQASIFIVFAYCTFYHAFNKKKLIYNKKESVLLCYFLMASVAYIVIVLWSKGLAIGLEKIKLLLFLFYLVVIPQFLQITDIKKLFKLIIVCLSLLIIINLLIAPIKRFSLNRETVKSIIGFDVSNFCYNPNYFMCFLIFLFYTLSIKEKWQVKFGGLLLLICYCCILQRRFSFFVVLFLYPALIFKNNRRKFFIFSILVFTAFCMCSKYVECNGNQLMSLLKDFSLDKLFTCYKRCYIDSTSASEIINGLKRGKILTQTNSRQSSHNFYLHCLQYYNFIDVFLLFVFLYKTFNAVTLLFLSFCVVITSPLYFFVAFSIIYCKSIKGY